MMNMQNKECFRIISEINNDTFFQQSIALSAELDIAGTFIYKAIKEFSSIEIFGVSNKDFMFLYFASVGIERLQKILLILLQNPKDRDSYEKYCKSIITHDTAELQEKISKFKFNKKRIELPESCMAFLNILVEFYIHQRYERLTVNTYGGLEAHWIEVFLTEIGENLGFGEVLLNRPEQKEFIGRILAKISRIYYNAILEICFKNNIYTYELPSTSPALSVFLKESDNENFSLHEIIKDEELSVKEFLLYISKNPIALKFDYELRHNSEQGMIEYYLKEINAGRPDLLVQDMNCLYDEMGIDKNARRIELSKP